MSNKERLKEIRKFRGASETKLQRATRRVREHPLRILILALLAKTETCLTPGQIRSRLPGPRRDQRVIEHHLRILAGDGFVQGCPDPPTAFELP
jgi:hypothetical protein